MFQNGETISPRATVSPYLVVVEGLLGGELPAALVGGERAVGLGADPHQPARVAQQQRRVGLVLDGVEVLHALLKAGEALLPQLLLRHGHRGPPWRMEETQQPGGGGHLTSRE